MLAFWAEWLRFRRNPANVAILLAYCATLALCAAWSAHSAQHQHLANDEVVATSAALIQQAKEGGASLDAATDPKRAAMHAFSLGRSLAGPAQLLPGPGLALSLSPHQIMNTRVAVSVESRHADGRRSDSLSNPMLAKYRALDLAAVVALLMPLVAIGLCAGSVQEDRERGTWRVLCAQAARPWQPWHAALALRAAVLWLPAALTCSVAIISSAGEGTQAVSGVIWWALCLAVYAGFWIALCGVLAQLPVSSAAAMLTSLTLWLLLTFAVPAALQAVASTRYPMPSRLASIVDLRQAQQEAEVRMPELLTTWYADHPHSAPLFIGQHTWPITFLPRFEYQDQLTRQSIRRFDERRLIQSQFMEGWAWVSPPMALLQVADHLAGISAAHYTSFLDSVDRYEQTWREFFVPRIMSYRGLSADDYAHIPRFNRAVLTSVEAVTLLFGKLLFPTFVIMVLLFILRRRIARL